MSWSRARVVFAIVASSSILANSETSMTAGPPAYTDWSLAINLQEILGTHPDVNTPFNDGCPAVSRDGRSLFMASNRPGSLINPATGLPGLDIWISHRDRDNEPWSEPVPLPPPINSPQNDFCPAPLRNGHGLLFVSERPGYCGGSDIFLVREHGHEGWSDLLHLDDDCVGVNSAASEASPFIVEHGDGGAELYFSSNRPGGFWLEAPGATVGDSDIYVSRIYPDGAAGVPELADNLNTAADDSRPNVRRDGLEIFFDSTRPGSIPGPNQLPSVDLWTASRERVTDPWSEPRHLESNTNTGSAETRAYLSWDATTLYFGSTRAGGEGSTDIYIATRQKITGRR